MQGIKVVAGLGVIVLVLVMSQFDPLGLMGGGAPSGEAGKPVVRSLTTDEGGGLSARMNNTDSNKGMIGKKAPVRPVETTEEEYSALDTVLRAIGVGD